MVYFCYIDESGTPQLPGNTSHYILCGISIPIKYWKKCEKEIDDLKNKYNLKDVEIHTGWIRRKYAKQAEINDFASLSYDERRRKVTKIRHNIILSIQKKNIKRASYKQTLKNFKQTEAYIHLSYSERIKFIEELADLINGWKFARIFAECIDKRHFDSARAKKTVDEQAFEQIVSRFELFLKNKNKSNEKVFGVLIHDNNQTVSKKHTDLMKKFHETGTLWTSISHIVETPFFVNSELTSLIQIADLCSYALRRYFENQEDILFNKIKDRFDKKGNKIVGVRHFTDEHCACYLCK